jgi:hypothetical protein
MRSKLSDMMAMSIFNITSVPNKDINSAIADVAARSLTSVWS